MIYLPPPQPVLNKDIRIGGDVKIHPTASLAPGVILQAAPGHRIAIGADVCIGMGVIINASQGSVEIEDGAIVGSGVLIIGACRIGNNACIGTAVTIFQTGVEPMIVIEPGSVLGDGSRKLEVKETPASRKAKKVDQNVGESDRKDNSQTQQTKVENNSKQSIKPPKPVQETTVNPKKEGKKEAVVGEVYISQLLVTLFPHKKDFDSKVKKLE